MRLLEYEQELSGYGYIVIGGNLYYDNLSGDQCMPIKMTSLCCLHFPTVPEGLAEDLVSAVYIDWDKKEETGFFYWNYADIIRGKYPDWQLISFRVVVGHLCLNFYNSQTDEYGYLLLEVIRMMISVFGLIFQDLMVDWKNSTWYQSIIIIVNMKEPK